MVEKTDGMKHGEDLWVDGVVLLTWILKEHDGRARKGLISRRIGTSGGLL